MACLYKKQSKKGVKIFDCFQHLVLKSFILIRCYLDLKNSIKSKFTIKTISMTSRLILFRDDNFFDIFYSMFFFLCPGFPRKFPQLILGYFLRHYLRCFRFIFSKASLVAGIFLLGY